MHQKTQHTASPVDEAASKVSVADTYILKVSFNSTNHPI